MSIISLWLPILATAVVIFIAGAVIWMAMPWHNTEWKKTTDEPAARNALKGLAPGQYSIPHCTSNSQMNSPEIQAQFKEGPVAFINVLPSGVPAMGKNLVQMFLYNLLVAVLCAYMVSRTLPAGADYLAVFRISGTTAFIAYGVAYVQESIWFGRAWRATAHNFLDALIYGALTGGVFGWLA